MSVACLIRHSCSKRYNGCLGQSTARRRTLTSNSLRISTRESSSQASVRSSSSSYNIWIAPLAIESVYSVASFGHELIRTTRCEQHAIVSYPTRQKQPSISTPTFHIDASKWERLRKAIIRYWRAMKRIVQLSLTLAPVAILYPLARMMQSSTNDECEHLDAHEILLAQDLQKQHAQGFIGWYLRLCLSCVEYSGAAVIKLMQWAGSRPDLFGHDFCTVFSALQDHTTPHHKSHTVKVLKQAFGDDWESKITLGDILGSGCIGQVYKGYLPAKNNKPVAVKVLHPNAEPDMEADLDLMRAAVRVARWLPFDVFSNLKWLNLEGVVEEFADLLKLQLDLRTEAANLERFNQNFANQDDIIFPKLVSGYAATKDVLVETFVEGVPVLEYARKNAHNQAQLTTLCTTAIRAVCKMIFLDNMMHGDLHGGKKSMQWILEVFILSRTLHIWVA
ncbi:hypothetical protein MPSEU_000576400 [Mayamaea pseudoterrestris]|nr:hypothetical protein MPSEU_000576400 [Mayamaea pseudoterrestris]